MHAIAKTGLSVLLAVAALGARAEVDRRPLQVPLTAKPLQADALQASPITGGRERAIALRVEDGRGANAGATVGRAVDDGTPVYPITATGDVGRYVEDVTRNVLASAGLEVGDAAFGTLTVRFTTFNVDHNNRAVGATYVGDTTIDYVLANRAGRMLAKGTASGNVDHYGKGRSVEGCNEVLGESLAAALSQMLGDADFRKVWSMPLQAAQAAPEAASASAKAVPANGAKRAADKGRPGKSPEARLRKLDELHRGGIITDDEYAQQRAKILDEI